MKFSSGLLAGILILQSAQAATTLVSYDFDGLAAGVDPTGSSGYPTLKKGAWFTGVQVQSSSSYVNATYEDQWDSQLMRTSIRGNPAQGIYIQTLEDAVTRNAYLQIDYTPTIPTSFSSITLDAASALASTTERTVGITLRSSATGDLNLGSTVVVNAMINWGEIQKVSFDLSGFDTLQNVTEPINFFLYLDTQGVAASGLLYADNLTLNGTAVPEPTSWGLLAVGAAGMLMRRRREA